MSKAKVSTIFFNNKQYNCAATFSRMKIFRTTEMMGYDIRDPFTNKILAVLCEFECPVISYYIFDLLMKITMDRDGRINRDKLIKYKFIEPND